MEMTGNQNVGIEPVWVNSFHILGDVPEQRYVFRQSEEVLPSIRYTGDEVDGIRDVVSSNVRHNRENLRG